MATSGVQSFTLTVSELVTLSMLDIGALAIGESPTSAEMADAIRRLNLLMITLQNTKVFLYKEDTATLDTVVDTANYNLENATKRLIHAYITVDNVDTPLNLLTYADYDRILQKSPSGIPTDLVVNHNSTPLTTTLYPVPTEVYTITYRRYVLFDSVTNEAETLDIDVEGLPMLQKGLSYFLANSYRIDLQERNMLFEEYKGARLLYTGQDTQSNSTDIRVPRGTLIT